uniref:CCHC-type domain-containing protein n=1 Tax=viral metagenome TaxID=1070528 RepID=A0A6C0LCL2_9ZZZZ
MSCNYCRKPGQFKKTCPKLLNKPVDPAYESAMKKGLFEPLTKEEERAVSAHNRARLYAAEHRKAFLEREQHRKKPGEDQGAYMFRCFKRKRDARTVARVVTPEEQDQWLRNERNYFEEMKRDRESSALWEKDEEERQAMHAKMTLR